MSFFSVFQAFVPIMNTDLLINVVVYFLSLVLMRGVCMIASFFNAELDHRDIAYSEREY